jgi:hypothetical protein
MNARTSRGPIGVSMCGLVDLGRYLSGRVRQKILAVGLLTRSLGGAEHEPWWGFGGRLSGGRRGRGGDGVHGRADRPCGRQRGHGRPSARCRWTLAGRVPVCPPAPGVRVLQRGLDTARRWVHSADRAGGRLARAGDGAGGVRAVRRVLRERMLESGKVSFYPNCDYLGEGRFVSRLSGKRYEVHSRRRGVDARYLSPQIHPPIGRGCRCWAIGLVVRVSPRHQGVGRSGLAQRGSHPPGYGRLRRTDSCRGSDSACTSGRGWPGWPNSLPRPVFNRSSGCRKPHRLTPFRVTNDVTPDHTAQGSTPLFPLSRSTSTSATSGRSSRDSTRVPAPEPAPTRSGSGVVGRLDQHRYALGPGSVHFLLVVVVAPELDEPAVLDAQHEHCPFTIERFTPRAAGHFDQRYREPVVS